MENYTPQVTKEEVANYEKAFQEKVTPNVKFHTYDNGLSMNLYKGESGSEAVFSGVISIDGDNNINWNFSLQNGLAINSKTELNKEILEIMTNLANFYNEWKSDWEQVLNIPGADVEAQAAPETTAEAPIETGDNVKSSLQESASTQKRKLSILNSFERMKSLSGIK